MMKKILLFFIVSVISLNISAQEWSHIGLDGKSVWQLEIHEDTFYAATNLGFYKKEVNSGDTNWDEVGFANEPINRFVKYGNEILLSKSVESGTALYHSNDNGETWEEYQNGYGGEYWTNVYTLGRNNETGRLYAGGTANIAVSDDNGTSWTPTWGDWDWVFMGIGMLTIDPTNTDVVYAGGMNAIFESAFFKSTDGGDNWAELGSPNGWGYDDKCMALTVDYENPDTLYMAMMHNAIIKSTDAGQTWNEVLNITDPNPYIYAVFSDVRVDPIDSQTIYATKYTKHITNGLAEQYLEMYKSTNGGDDWETINSDVSGFTGGSELLIDSNGDVYLCSINKGIYKYGEAESSYIVTFVVDDENGNMIENVEINFNNTTVITNDLGQATVSINPGTYDFTAVSEGHEEYSNTFIVEDQDIEVQVHLTTLVGISQTQQTTTTTTIYPNPAHQQLNIRNRAGSILEILSIQGEVIEQKEITSNLEQLNIEHLSKGIYFVRFSKRSEYNFEKLIIQ